MNELGKKSLLSMVLSFGLAFVAGATFAVDPPCDKCIKGFCHNIGGPQELGANCDGATGACQYSLDTGGAITVASNHFLGILIPPTSEGAIAAHIAHGDGPTIATFDPPLHLASTGQIHKASNVECLGLRVVFQPPEPGN